MTSPRSRIKQRQLSKTQCLGLVVASILLVATAYNLLDSPTLSSEPTLIASSSLEDDGKYDWMVVATMFSDTPKYIASLGAQMDTWLSGVPLHRIFAVGPNVTLDSTPDGNQYPRIIPITQPDRELWMKRLQQFTEAHRLLQSGVEFDWLLSGNEDWYVNMDKMKEILDTEGVNPREEAVVYSGFGCGQHWQYHKNSKNNTVPAPPQWTKRFVCHEVAEFGGFCAGVGVVATRKAVEIMLEDGVEAFYAKATALPLLHTDDIILSCVVYAYGGRVQQRVQIWPHITGVASWMKTEPRRTVTVMHARPDSPDGMSPAEMIRTVYAHDFPKQSD